MPATAARLLFIAIAMLLAACASSRTLGGSVDDLSANATLKRVLFTDRKYDYDDIDLTILDGRLLLTGTMRSEAGRQRLLENAWKASAVRQVIDEVLIEDKTSFGQSLADSRIDKTLRGRLVGDRSVSHSNYKFAVSRGVVYVLGVARDEIELDRVLTAARQISGVNGVVSHVLYRNAPLK